MYNMEGGDEYVYILVHIYKCICIYERNLEDKYFTPISFEHMLHLK